MRVFNSRGARMRSCEGFDQCSCGFYVFSSILLQQIRSMHVFHSFPCVITPRVSSPLDQILQGATAPKAPVIPDSFHFIFFFPFY
jgi:hypothetical protein